MLNRQAEVQMPQNSLSQSFYPAGTLEIIFRYQGTPA
jgi:hypothetical protein